MCSAVSTQLLSHACRCFRKSSSTPLIYGCTTAHNTTHDTAQPRRTERIINIHPHKTHASLSFHHLIPRNGDRNII